MSTEGNQSNYLAVVLTVGGEFLPVTTPQEAKAVIEPQMVCIFGYPVLPQEHALEKALMPTVALMETGTVHRFPAKIVRKFAADVLA